MASLGIDISRFIIFDTEPINHLHKDCGGDVSKLKLGLAGIKFLQENKFEFYEGSCIGKLRDKLLFAEYIIGFNLIGHNGLDYKILENHGMDIKPLFKKTYDLMTAMVRTFGSYQDMSLDNIINNTFGIRKKHSNKANYKLLRSGRIDEVKQNLQHELKVIEKLFLHICKEEPIQFETSMGLIDKHEISFFAGFYPEFGEGITKPYDFPIGGMRLQIKEMFDEVIKCNKCKRVWRIKSVSYYGDTLSQKVNCPVCTNFLIEVNTSLLGGEVEVSNV